MEFNESIKQFSERVSMMKDTVSTEEATKCLNRTAVSNTWV